MPENTSEPRGMTAAQARRQPKRDKHPSTKSAPNHYTIRRNGETVLENGTLADVRKLLPNVRSSLLSRRLSGGERDYDRLARPPEDPAARKRKMGEVPMYRRRK